MACGGSLRFLAIPALAISSTLVFVPTSVLGDVKVGGTQEAARIEIQNGSVDEVLATLGKTFGLRYKSAAALNARLDGTFVGPLHSVIRRLLEGYDYVMNAENDRIELIVLAAQGGSGGTASKVTATNNPLSPTSPATIADAPASVGASKALEPPLVVAEGDSAVPEPGQNLDSIKPPVPSASVVPPPMPGVGATILVPEPRRSLVAPPVGSLQSKPDDKESAPPSRP
jgi:hypothetical protein